MRGAAVPAKLLPLAVISFTCAGPKVSYGRFSRGYAKLAYGVYCSHIHYELFGAGELGEPEEVVPTILPERAQITFARSEVQAEWTNQSGTLLEVAGLKPNYNGRSGKCSSCATRLISGSVHYPRQPVITPAKGEVLTCCAVPMEGQVSIDL